MTGSAIGPYQITATLGAGGMGEVFLARDTRLHRDVAVKVLPKAFAADADRLRRFQEEAKTLAALNHPNVLTIHDFGVHEGLPYLVSERLEGQTLRQALDGTGALPVRKATDYALQLAHGLAAAHGRGIIHRDLKPENIFITKDGRVKILDFGLAKLQSPHLQSEISDLKSGANETDPTTLQAATQAGVVLGTPSYMSPEQVRGKPADHRSDIFAFGCVLYEMLTGKRAFRRDTPVESMNAVLKEEAPELSDSHRPIPPAIDRVVRRCLEKEPERRFQSASDLAFALESTSSTVATVSSPVVETGRQVDLARVLPWAVAAICLVGLIAVLIQRPEQRPAPASSALSSPATPAVGPLRLFELPIPTPTTRMGDGEELHATISPDGRKIAYATTEGLWIRWLDRLGSPVLLVAGENIVRPFWSPASTDVAYFEGQRLARVAVEGGRPLTMAAVPDHNVVGAEGAAWLANDHVYFASGNSGLNEVPAQGGTAKALWEPDNSAGEVDIHEPSGLPGGAGVLLVVHRTVGVDTIAVWTRAGEKKVLLQTPGSNYRYPAYSPTGHVLFQRAGDVQGLWAFPFSLERLERTGEPFRVHETGVMPNVSNDGTLVCVPGSDYIWAPRQMVWVDTAGRILGTVGPALPALTTPRLSPDERRIVAVAGESLPALELWVVEVDGSGALPVTRNQEPDLLPFWSPDSQALTFCRGLGNARMSLTKPGEVTGEEKPLLQGSVYPSPGSKYLLVGHGQTNNLNLWRWSYLEPPATNASPLPLAKLFGLVHQPGFSADERWLAFSAAISGKEEIWVVEFPGLQKKLMVSRGGGRLPVWHPKKQELFYLTLDGRALMSARLHADQGRFDEPTKVFDLPDSIFAGMGSVLPIYSVSADGQRFLMLQTANDPKQRSGQSHVLLIQNWASSSSP